MKSNRQSFLFLAIGAALMLFSNGRWTISFAAWLYPVFFLHFMRLHKPAKGFFLVVLASAIVYPIIWWKMFPFPVSFYFILTGFIFQLFNLSFLADRLLATRIKGFASTLVFPATYCTVEYLLATYTPKGTWASLAYSQITNLSLMQLVSVTGIWGIIFLITWFASVVNWAWEQEFEWKNINRGSISFACITVSILLFGVFRVNFYKPQQNSVRTASIVQARSINKDLTSCKWTDAKGISNYSAEAEENLLEKTKQAADAGAKIVLWQEAASWLAKQDEQQFISKAMSVASEKKIYLLMTLWSVPEDFPKHKVENKLIVIDPDGTQLLTYIKNNPAPPEPIIKGNGVIPALQTVYGKIAPAICADADYPGFIRQAGKNKVDIMFIPANDWKAIDPIHTNMAITRAIENGFSLVHPAGQGLSVATDNCGRIISSMDYYKTDEQIMYADIPAESAFTLYPLIGDAFAWLCIAGFIIFLAGSVFKKYFLRIKGSYQDNDTNSKMKTSPDLG